MKVLVIGETCQDIFCYGDCTRLAPEAPVPVFTLISEKYSPGMATHVQRNIQSLGVECDVFTNYNWESVQKVRYVDDRTNQMFIRIDKNDHKIKRCDVTEIEFECYDAIVVSDYNKGFLEESDLEYIFENHPVTFLDTKKVLGSWSDKAKYIKINSIEYNNSKLSLNEHYNKKLIVTTGKHGCRYNSKEYAVEKVGIKDVSGAGDTFLAALVAEYLRTKDITEAITFANECSTEVVQKRGVTVINE